MFKIRRHHGAGDSAIFRLIGLVINALIVRDFRLGMRPTLDNPVKGLNMADYAIWRT